MGLFDLHCPLTGLPLRGLAQVVVVERTARGRWRALSAATRGTYDRSGFVNPSADGLRQAFLDWATAATGCDDPWDALQALTGDGRDIAGRRIGYALVDAVAFDAVVALGGAWEGGDVLPEELRRPVAARAPEIRPSSVERSGQYSGLEGAYGCAKVIHAARRRCARDPALLAAVDACEQRWRR